MVCLQLRPYRMILARKVNEKLAPKFFGPYVITQRFGEVAYHVNLPAEC